MKEIIGWKNICKECEKDVEYSYKDKIKHLDLEHFGWINQFFKSERVYKNDNTS